MKAAWLDELGYELQLMRNEQPTIEKVDVHCKIGDEWLIAPAASIGRDMLDKALSDNAPQKVGRQKRYLFGLVEDRLVIDVQFNVFPKARGREQARRAIDRARDHTRHRFDAHHDSLTGSKNRKSFDSSIRAAISTVPRVAPSTVSALGEESSIAISLVSLDIDFFKRVNDSRGHDYGDLVLRGFAWLIEDLCEKASAEIAGTEFTFFRLGGEEFNILVSGAIGEGELLDWVESVRAEVERSFIPSDSQILIMARDVGANVPVPAHADRRITSSFGVARASSPFSDGDLAQVVSRLKTQADKALYSAKNAGRNRVRYFPDILKRFGRVIENDRSAGIVVIDIGSEVGVKRGREFFVVPERYTGDSHYIVDDGRTRRRLGTYPRLRIAKIVAFDVQEEISFCSITGHIVGTEVAPGCLLESIPLGLFGGLSPPHEASVGLGESDGQLLLKNALLTIEEENRRVVALRLRSLEEVDRTRGQAKANELLAATAATLARVLPPPLKIEQIEVGQFGAVFSASDVLATQKLDELIESMRGICGDVLTFSLGLFDKQAMRDLEGTNFSLSWDHAYDYAVIAAAAAAPATFERFDHASPTVVLAQYADGGQHEQVIADHLRFGEIGVVNAEILNRAGMALFLSGRLEEANSEFRAALELDSGDAAIRSNYGISQFLLKNYQEAFTQLSESARLRGNPHPRGSILAAYAIAAHETRKASGIPDAEFVAGVFTAAFGESRSFFVKRERLEMAKAEFEADLQRQEASELRN